MGKIFKFTEFTFLENLLIRDIFTPAVPTQNSPWAEQNYSFPLAAFFRKSVSPNSRKGWGNYDLPYQNLVRKYEDDLED